MAAKKKTVKRRVVDRTYRPKEFDTLARDCVQMHARLMRAGLCSTGQKMHDVVREIGYEMARVRKKLGIV